MREPSDNFGLYLHVPYCRALCHYCDFAKTANFTEEHGRRYLARLREDLDAWLATLAATGDRRPFDTVFFGGGTPSLFTRDYEPLMRVIRAAARPDAEITLECNPDDVTDERLAVWSDLGVTRLSLGVQTFDASGLAFLKRIHDGDAARRAVERALAVFATVNLDLIYGWGNQTAGQLARDLDEVVQLGLGHVSLYTLTYETRTPLGRAANRGRVVPQSDEHLADLYALACERLGAAGFDHEEVSNWAKPGHACRHNWGYWQDQPYLGVGAGAHGYLRMGAGPGLRYEYRRDDRVFLKRLAPPGGAPELAAASLAAVFGVEVEEGRTSELWLTDYVGASFRTRRGIDLARVRAQTGRELRPTPTLAEGLETGLVRQAGTALVLDPREWFRETAWGVEALRSLPEASSKPR